MADKIVNITRAMAAEKLGFCRKGLRAFIDNAGLDWEKFCTDGLPVDDIRKTGDARALALIEELEK